MHRAGRRGRERRAGASDRHAAGVGRRRARRGRGTSARDRPYRCGLVDRLRRADVAQLGRPVGGDDEHRHVGQAGLDDRRVEVGRRRAARAQQHRRRRRRARGRGRRTPAARSSWTTWTRAARRAPARASAIGVLRDPGATTAWRDAAARPTRRRAWRRTSPARRRAVTSRSTIRHRRYASVPTVARRDRSAGRRRRPMHDRDLVRRRLPVVLHRQAPVRARRSTTLGDDPTFDGVDVVYRPFQLDPTAPPGTPMPVAEAYARKFGGPERAAGDHRPRHRDRRRRGARVPPRPGPAGQHRATPTACCGAPSTHGPPVAQATLKERLLRGLLHRRSRHRRPRGARRRAPPTSASTPTTCAQFLDGDDGRRRGRWPSACARRRAGITAVPTYVVDGALGDPRRPGPRHVRAGAAPPGGDRTSPADAARAPTVAAPDAGSSSSTASPRPAASWDAGRRSLAADGYEVVAVDAPGHGGSADVARRPRRRRRRCSARAGGRATYVGYSMGGRLCLHLAVARPTSSSGWCWSAPPPGIDDAGERAAAPGRRRRAGRRRSSATASTRSSTAGWPSRCSPALARRRRLDDRRRNTAAGLASSLRLAGTGTQEPLWDRARRR